MTRVRGYFRSLNTVLLALLGLSAAHVIPLHAAENPGLPRTIAWSAYPTGTGGYSQAVAIGSILRREYGVNLRVIPGRNDVSRLATLLAGRVHFSAGGSEAVYAQEGVLNFAARTWGPQPLRALMSNYSDSCSFTVATAADANIRSIEDVRGKRVTWVQGSPSLNNALAALLAYGNLTWNDVERVEVGGYNASIEAVINNRADVVGGACNSPPFLRLEASPRGLHFISFPHDNTEAVQRTRSLLPWYVTHIATEGPTIPPEGIEVFTSAYPLLVGMDSADDTLVYNMVKVMHEHFNEYKDAAPGAGGWLISRQKFESAFIPYHPAAIRYFREIGVWTDAAEATQQANLYRQQVLHEAWLAYREHAPEDPREFSAGWLKAREQALAEKGLLTLAENI
ncbi:MAG: TAXI family TRAP transporter solute-binding subunit [Pseudomonadales bacterium]|nr:TAXI family TRAP transporter solute-binding subunit [Pseudomonadales bacterium]MCP5357687.1 TAXI family TRAP transporter solute-binding subunit [Pseudomonadales bacterium]